MILFKVRFSSVWSSSPVIPERTENWNFRFSPVWQEKRPQYCKWYDRRRDHSTVNGVKWAFCGSCFRFSQFGLSCFRVNRFCLKHGIVFQMYPFSTLLHLQHSARLQIRTLSCCK
jgi:hypothetical protein